MPNIEPDAFATLILRAEQLLDRVEALFERKLREPDWSASHAFRYRRRQGYPVIEAILRPALISFSDLCIIERQKAAVLQNTRQFLQGLPANNVLLTGARGTGKSSLIRACLDGFAKEGLRIIEVDKADLADLSDLVDVIARRDERFIIFCDDLSFEEGESGYKALKAALDGSLAASAENLLIYATSNRRHLMPEQMRDNLSMVHQDDGEIHPGEVIEEKISLSERFGLWLSFYPFRQDEYLAIVAHWLDHFGHADDSYEVRDEALRFALERGSRSGRVALQFARDFAGRRGLEKT
jgi:predicted AAA+ superfamily ATPase